jgi:hypothetical protein
MRFSKMGRSASKTKIHSLFALLALSVGGGPSAVEAALPLETLIRSAAGRTLFTEVTAGPAAVARILGAPVEAASRQTMLLEAFSDPRMTAVAEEFSSRLNRMEARFKQQFPESRIFEESNRVLNAAERAAFLRIANEELSAEFVRFLPSRPSGSLRTYAASREAFLTEHVLRRTPETALEKLNRWRATSYRDREYNVAIHRLYERVAEASPELKSVFPSLSTLELLADSAATPLIRKLERILSRSNQGPGVTRTEWIQELRYNLRSRVPVASVETRIRNYLRDPSSLPALKRALGELTLEESQFMLHGGNPLAPTADSLIGKYLADTGATSGVRSFAPTPQSGVRGDARLVVNVDERTYASWSQHFGNEHLFGQLHTPMQGTLMVTFDAKLATWQGVRGDMRMPILDSFSPMVVLSSSEGGRLHRFFAYGTDFDSFTRIRNPWVQAEYCARGAYGSCTHWFGNLPIGDRLVTEYKFPGWIDHDPYTPVPDRGPHDPAPRIDTLNPYQAAESDEALRDILRYPGHEQLADVIGLTRQQLGAELANPGWTAYAVLGGAPVERVPVVFRFVQDARAPFDPNFNLRIDAH